MRNLKRALSLLLSSTMVLGMLVMGSSAKSFADAEDISNVEAVTIVDGLDVMNGYPDGSFKPEGIVTRAEMAVVISKMLYGPEFNPANFEGAGVFTDTPDWAEGYINLCASLGIIAGRGNGIFDPNATVTTSEAAAMFLRTLGYLQTAEEFGTDWQLAVTSKATNLGLYGDLKLSINEGLSRENVAEMAFNTLFAQRVAYDDYRGLYVKANDRNVVVTNGTEDENNTLAQNTFGLYIAEGVVTANGMTDEKLSESLKSAAQTEVTFTEDTDLNKDGVKDYNKGESYDFEVETDLDMIGHAVSVYYKMENKAPVVYAIVDEASLVSYIDYSSNTSDLADAANDAGFKKNSILDINVNDYIVNYDFDATVGNGDLATANIDTLLVISNSGNNQVDYVIALDQYLDTVKEIDDYDKDNITYTLTTAPNEGNDMTIAMDDVKEGDYVIVTNIGNQGDVLVFQAAKLVSADISKITGVSVGSNTVRKITADGVEYTKSDVDPYLRGTSALDDTMAFLDIDVIGEATLILDQFGDLIGLAEEATLPNYAYVAQYGIQHVTSGLTTKDVLTALVYFADGTHDVYQVDTDIAGNAFNAATYAAGTIDNGWVNALNESIGQDTADDYSDGTGAIGLWNATVQSDGTVELGKLTTSVSGPKADDVKLVKGHSTLLTAAGASVTGFSPAKALYQNNETVYFYVTGSYSATAPHYGLTVVPIVGIKNAVGFTNDTGAGDGIQQAFATNGTRAVIDTMLIEGIAVGEAEGVYYYNRGNYEITAAETGKYVVTYYLNDVNGDATSHTYDNEGNYWTSSSAAKSWAEANKPSGFYTIGATDLVVKFNTYNSKDADSSDKITYVVGANANYDVYTDNLFDDVAPYGTISENTKVVDLTDNGLTSVSRIVRELKNGASIDISYSYNDDTYVTDVLYVTSYSAAPISGGGANSDLFVNAVLNTASSNGVKLDVNVVTTPAITNVTVNYQVQMSSNNGETWTNVGTEQTNFALTDRTGGLWSKGITSNILSSATYGYTYRLVIDVMGDWTDSNGSHVGETIVEGYTTNLALAK